MTRYISASLIIALLTPSLAASARTEHDSARAASARLRRASIAIELRSGEVIEGRLETIGRHQLRVEGEASVSTVELADIRSVTDLASGERFEMQPPPIGRMPKPGHTSVKAWLIAGAIVGALFVWLLVALPHD